MFASPVAVAPGAVPAAVSGAGSPRAVAFTDLAPDDRAAVAVDAALAQIGLPYVWGGDGPAAGDAGFDCSGLTHFAYAAAGIDLPRTAHTPYYAGPRLPEGAPLRPGDLVFYGVPERVRHVGLYLGDGRMVNAPRFGKPVQVAYHRWPGDAYLGAGRPAASGEPGLLPPLPAPIPLPMIPVPELFEAPPASLPDGLELPERVLTAGPEQVVEPVPVEVPAPAPATAPAATGDPEPAVDVAAPPQLEPRPSQAPAPSLPGRSSVTPLPEPVAAEPVEADAPVEASMAMVLSFPGGEVEVAPVAAGPDGLPAAVGVTDAVIRVPAGLLDGVAVGVSVVRTAGDGSTPLTVRSVELLTAAEARTRSGTVMVAPSDTGLWHVVVAR